MTNQRIHPATEPTFCVRYADGATPATVTVILPGETTPRRMEDPAISPQVRALAALALANHNARERAARSRQLAA